MTSRYYSDGMRMVAAGVWLGFLLVTLGAAQNVPSPAPAAVNLVPNPGFEMGQRHWLFWPRDTTTKTVFEIDDTTYRSGKASARITSTDMADTGSIYTYIPLKAGTKYRVAFAYKLKGIIPDSALISLALNFNKQDGANGSAGRELLRLPAGIATTEWQTLEATFTAPAATVLAQFVVGTDHISGTVWLDDIEVHETRPVNAAKQPPVATALDGVLSSARWRGIEAATGFLRNIPSLPLAEKQTRVYLTYDSDNIYVKIECDEPNMAGLAAKATEHDGAVSDGMDDCVELFLCPHEITYHFIINSLNAVYDAKITGSDTSALGFIRDASYNPRFLSQAHQGETGWSVEMAIPFSELGGTPQEGDTWRFNVARVARQNKEYSSYSPLSGLFYQLARFSTLTFNEGNTVLTRSDKDLSNPFRVVRDKPLFEELLSSDPGNYVVRTSTHDFYPLNQRFLKNELTHEEWVNTALTMLAELGEAGMMGPSLNAESSSRLGSSTNMQFWSTREACLQHYEKYGMQRYFYLETSHCARRAIRKGAEILTGQTRQQALHVRPRNAVSVIDPIYNAVVIDDIKKAATTYKDEPYLDHFFGRDEPIIPAIKGKMQDISPQTRGWNEEVTEQYGFGKYGIPAPADPDYYTHKETHPFQWIAFNQWASDKFVASRKEMWNTLQAIAPRIKYIPCNFWTMRAFIPYDFDRMSECGDEIMCDPYPASGELRRGRGVFSVGFTTKLLRDLTSLPTWCFIQAFDYDNYAPEPEDLRAWVSEALKIGATRIVMYEEDSPRHTNPARYEVILRISAFVNRMRKVKLPQNPDTAIFYSSASHRAEGGSCRGDEVYTAYSLVGERAGSWFDFVSDTQLARGKKQLTDYRMVYIPLATYQDKAVVKIIEDYVLQGGTVVIGDPHAFSWDINGADLSASRERILGVRTGDVLQPKELSLTQDLLGFQAGEIFKIYPNYIPLEQTAPCYNYRRSFETRTVIPVDKAIRILGQFKTGEPAILERPYGKGKIVYFTANPFIPDTVHEKPAQWAQFFTELQKEAGCQVALPIWRFELPKDVVAAR